MHAHHYHKGLWTGLGAPTQGVPGAQAGCADVPHSSHLHCQRSVLLQVPVLRPVRLLLQLMFSGDGNYLYTGARQDDQMYCWDVRHTYNSLYCMTRDTARTNQRVQFDIEPCGRHLLTGGCGGGVTVRGGVQPPAIATQ